MENVDQHVQEQPQEEIQGKPEVGPAEKRNGTWATPVGRLNVEGVSDRAINLNVQGRQLTGPLKGFGQLWQKTYRIRLSEAQVEPTEVIRVWKQEFPSFWPKGNYFYARVKDIQVGEVAVLNLAGPYGITAPGGRPIVSTGILVIYADDESFSFMTPQGHMFAGMNTFSAYEEDGHTVVQIQVLVRASDPIYELGARMGVVHKTEDDFWKQTLVNLAKRFGVEDQATQETVCIDPSMQWSEFRNLWHNAAVRTAIYLVLSPFRWAGKLLTRP